MKRNKPDVIWREILLGPVRPRTWWATAHLVMGALVSGAGLVLLALLLLSTVFLVTLPVVLPLLFPLVWGLASLHRSRFAGLLGERVDPLPRNHPEGRRERLVAQAFDRNTWRQAWFHVVAAVTETGSALLAAGLWSTAFGLLFLSALSLAAPRMLRDAEFIDPSNAQLETALVLVGVFLLFATPWVVRALAALDLAMARALLGPDQAKRLSHRVEVLTESRSAVVDAADAERRRIERDLHDGTQQRLVSLAMNLGMARAMNPDLPEIAEAHEEAKLALAELRDFVRGLHPAVLNDRGLDAALSGIAARSPVPVTLAVDLPSRPSPTTEAVAYFVVSEALANAAKHAQAGSAEVNVSHVRGTVRVVVTDDGIGGAHPGKGSGLRGLVQRVESIDGTLTVHSPVGGPTTLTAELPCAS
ncbi:sensor histidine kinase [Actinocorallia populi]|uniref:sensor histidine kinase n=1 Tax=Actinocorallia populi TaxID=2079200 RepID=UPI001E42922C|nr:sensor domain-containing protein [Actinocorallia populi]